MASYLAKSVRGAVEEIVVSWVGSGSLFHCCVYYWV